MNDRSPPTTVEPDDPESDETKADQLGPLGALGRLTQVTPLGYAVIKHQSPTPCHRSDHEKHTEQIWSALGSGSSTI